VIKSLFYNIFLAAIVGILTLSYLLTETTAGLKCLLQLTTSYVPGHLQIEHIQGKLFSDFSLQHITYASPTTNISVELLTLNWNPKQLFHTILDINQLEVKNIQIKTLTAKNSSSSIPIEKVTAFLNHIVARKINISHILWQQNQKPFVDLDNIQLHQQDDGTSIVTVAGSSLVFNKLGNSTWNIHWNINIPKINFIFPQSQGKFRSTGTISGPYLTPTLNANLQWNDLTVQNYHLKQLDLNLTGRMHTTQNNLAGTFEIAIARKPYINFSILLPKTITLDNYLTQPIAGKLTVQVSDLHKLTDSIPYIKNLRGRIAANMELTGNFAHPLIKGTINLVNTVVNIPKLGILVKKINLLIEGNQTGQLHFSGHLESGTGSATLNGAMNLGDHNLPTQLTIQGNNVEVVNLTEYHILCSPDLKIQLTLGSIGVTGKITIPQAKISPKNFSNTITLPDSVVFVDQPQDKASALLALLPTMNITLVLGDKIYVNSQNLETTLGGHIAISSHPNSPATASGNLYTIKGTYTAYGQVLDIQEGYLTYAGGLLTNPGLNIKAIRQIKTVQTTNTNMLGNTAQTYSGSQLLTVGVHVLGTLDHPDLTLFSSPAGLSQTDILSYLISGQASGNNSAALLSALVAFNSGSNGTSQISSITKKLQQNLGLTELNIGSTQSFNTTTNSVDSNTSLMIGKQLTPKLSLHYSVGIFNPISTFTLIYKLSKRWSLQSETSTIDNGADIIYSIERN
jgi:translocation and assembly module TamB